MKLLKDLFFALVVADATSTTIDVRLDHRGRWRLPIRVECYTDIHALVFLNFQAGYGFEYYGPDTTDDYLTGAADGYSIGENATFVATNLFAMPMVSDLRFWNTYAASIGVGFDSPFANMFNSFIITPTENVESSQLVLNPETPEQYAYQGQWFYVNSSNAEFPQIMASVSVDNSTESRPMVSVSLNSMEDVSRIPPEAIQSVLDRLQSAGFVIHGYDNGTPYPELSGPMDENSIGRGRPVLVWRNHETPGYDVIRFLGVTAAELAQVLPPIHFDVVSDSFQPQQMIRLTLLPEDYIDDADPERLTLLIRARSDGVYTIGMNVLRRISLHIDSRNLRIGFAEPVNEI